VLKTFKSGGVHPKEHKISSNRPIEQFLLPEEAHIPLSQHIGAPAEPVVKKGDKVKTGQLIAKASAFVSANIHSSVSGTVKKIDNIFTFSGYKCPAIQITVEGDEWDESILDQKEIRHDTELSSGQIIEKIKEAGIVGLGGATFPSNIKLSIPEGKKAEYVIINGAECEPYLTADFQIMLDKTEQLLAGISILKKALNVKQAFIGIENNKGMAIRRLRKYLATDESIKVVPLKVKYPQGGEKQLIKAILNREVPSGGLPIDVGVVVFNVGTTCAVYDAIQLNKPLIERVVTVTGKNVKRPSNFMVRIGTPVFNLIEYCGGLPGDTGKVIAGGPMMGVALNRMDIPVVKGTSGILLLPEDESQRDQSITCIRCGRCVNVCPMNLEPYLLNQLAQQESCEELYKNNIMDCIECGSCSYTCPAHIPLLDYIKLGKNKTGQMLKSTK